MDEQEVGGFCRDRAPLLLTGAAVGSLSVLSVSPGTGDVINPMERPEHAQPWVCQGVRASGMTGDGAVCVVRPGPHPAVQCRFSV